MLLSASFQSWLRHEVEVLVSVGQARQTLENLIDDRKLLSRQLAELRNQVEDEDNEPAAKVLTTVCLCMCVSVCPCGLSYYLSGLSACGMFLFVCL